VVGIELSGKVVQALNQRDSTKEELMAKRFIGTAVIALALTFGGLVGSRAIAASRGQTAASSATQQPSTMPDMTKMHEQMMAQMKADNAKLAELAKQMNAAQGTAKVDATAAVVNELVRQHLAMADHMSKMSGAMMGGGLTKKP
jgi:hypothetical protein